jgi:hypothetical protein
MSRAARNLLAWTCIALLATFVVQSNAALVLCVAVDHTAVESAHAGRECAPQSHSLGSTESCTDTVLSQSSTTATSERSSGLVLPVVAPLARVAPPRADALLRRSAPPPLRDLDRSRSSTVLLI